MARQRIITRTIKVAECETMLVNVETAEVRIEVLEISGEVDETTALKTLKKLYEDDTTKVVAIQNISIREELYGMPEIMFLKLAKRLDENRKMIDED